MTNGPSHKQPIAGVGAVVIHDDQVLLVKRATPPKQGLWCIPGGKIKFGETLQQAAEREIKEETGISIKSAEPIHVFDLIENTTFHYIIIDLLAEYISGVPAAGDDAAGAAWFKLENIDRPEIDLETKRLIKQVISSRQKGND